MFRSDAAENNLSVDPVVAVVNQRPTFDQEASAGSKLDAMRGRPCPLGVVSNVSELDSKRERS